MRNELSDTLRALADPTRREILKILGAGNRSAGEIAAGFELSLPSISHHLATLKHANLVSVERNGQSLVYSLNATVLQEGLQHLFTMFNVGRGDAQAVKAVPDGNKTQSKKGAS